MRDSQVVPPIMVCVFLLMVSLLPGCGGSDVSEGPSLADVKGKVLFGNEPLASADLTFFPTGTTEGIGGTVRTDESGAFQGVIYARGGEGLPAGTYKVAVSKRVMPDGSPVPPNDETPAIESPAQETMPPRYLSPEWSPLEVVVEDGKPLELVLKKT